MKLSFPTLCFVAATLISGCTTQIEDYQQQEALHIKDYFNGPLVARGMIQNYQDKVIRRFCVEIKSSWQGDKGLLEETFYFDDGEISYRDWQLTYLGNGLYHGGAQDVIGTAVGKESGFAFQLNYQLRLELENSTLDVNMDDWMYLLDKDRVINKTTMSKLGITLADITIIFDKTEPFSCL